MKIAIVGDGRMGRMIASIAASMPDVEIAGFVGPDHSASLEEIPDAELIMDFSYPGNLPMILETAARKQLPVVIGTTGYSEEEQQAILSAAETLPVVWTNNFSTGVTVLARLTRMAAEALGEDFDIEIVETHHRMKEDAPSGTALLLAEKADISGNTPQVYGRSGRMKRQNEIGIHALRGGTVAGEHRVLFYGPLEEIELRHRADSREIFARGALRAAQFAMTAAPGRYTMEDVLFGGK